MTRVFALTAAASHGYFEVEIPPFAAENCGLRLPRIPIFFPGVLHFDPGQPLVHHEVREPYHAEDYICILYLSLHLKKKIGTNNNHTHAKKKSLKCVLCTCVALHDGNITASFAKGMNAMSATTSETILGGKRLQFEGKKCQACDLYHIPTHCMETLADISFRESRREQNYNTERTLLNCVILQL